MSLRIVRIIYQITFFCLFVFLLIVTTEKLSQQFAIKTFINTSALIALSDIIANHKLTSSLFLSVIIVSATLFLGRFFCGWICPMGIVMHFISALNTNRDPKIRYRKNTYTNKRKTKYIILITIIICAFFGIVLTGFSDPIVLITRFFTTNITPLANFIFNKLSTQTITYELTITTTIIFALATLLNLYIPRFWCRYICPLGAILSLFSIKPLFRIVRDDEKCIHCGKCRESCQGGCNIDADFIPSECLMCMNCIDTCPVGAIRYGLPQNISKETELNGIKLSRRDFLTTGLLTLFTIGALKNIKKVFGRGNPTIIRPPGSINEPEFLSTCTRCGLCMKVCPTNVIQPMVTGDLETLWTPILNFNYGFCEYECTACSKVCPTQAIIPITTEEKKSNKGKIGTAFIDRTRCIPWSFGKECLVCQEVCPTSPKAIYYQTIPFTDASGNKYKINVPFIDAEQCIGCGNCQYNCPVQDLPAIRVTSIGEVRSPQKKLLL